MKPIPSPAQSSSPASLKTLLSPRTVAVIGASRGEGIGRRILDALLRGGFQGALYPVNPSAKSVASIPAHPSVEQIPGTVDLAIVAVPARAVPEVLAACGRKKVRGAVVITAGFAEAGPEGRRAEAEIAGIARRSGIRLVGPNCMGIANADPDVRLNGSLSSVLPGPGPVAMASQSGALGIAILRMLAERGLGLSTFVSLGNKADVSGNDLLEYWEKDPGTKTILLYLESFGNPRRFAPIARRVGRTKPIVVLKGGRTRAGQRAARSHTAALAAGEEAEEALFRQTGILRARTIEEMFDVASLLSLQPLPAGRRVGIVTNAGGPAILCADVCEAGGLSIPEFPDSLQRDLAVRIPGAASLRNPVDMIASAGPTEYRDAVQRLLASREVDALLVIHTPVDPSSSDDIFRAVGDGVARGRRAGGKEKPVLLCRMTREGTAGTQAIEGGETLPAYAFPENAARALVQAGRYARWRAAPHGVFEVFPSVDAARTACRAYLAERGPGWLSFVEAHGILAQAGFPVLAARAARTADEAASAALSLGFPVALKLSSRTILHKSDVGGVHLGLADEEAVRKAFGRIRDALGNAGRLADMEGVVVQPMAEAGTEVMAGISHDPLFGPVATFGLGGVHVEILGDASFGLPPLSDRDADRMIRGIKGFRLLEGYRGHPPADLAALRTLLLRLSHLAVSVPEIAEMDLNPVFALAPGKGCVLPDARIRLAEPFQTERRVA